MQIAEVRSLLTAYYELSMLKFEEQMTSGWGFKKVRNESVAEEVYGAQQWAWILWSEATEEIDIFKVIALLSVSEMNRIESPVLIFLGEYERQKELRDLIAEFEEEETREAKIAHLCKRLNKKSSIIKDVLTNIPETQIQAVLCINDILSSLKRKIRQGVIDWNVDGIRRESVAEHIYSAQQLAWVTWVMGQNDVDIYRVVSMISIHETEETILGNITPYSGVTAEEKKEMGQKAVHKVLGILEKYEQMHELINEYEDNKTPDAWFARLCNKLDCDLSIKYYSDCGFCDIDNATEEIRNHVTVRKLISSGARTVADVFIIADETMYKDSIFAEILGFAKISDVTQLY